MYYGVFWHRFWSSIKHMRNLILIAFMTLGVLGTSAQSTSKASSTIVEAKNYNVNAVSIEFPIGEKDMEDIFEKRIQALGAGKKTSKWSVSKKYRYYPGETLGEISTDKLDYYYYIDGNKTNSNITVFASHGYDNFVNEKDEKHIFDNIKFFLESMNEDVNAINWQYRVEAQKEVVKEHEKDLSKSQDNLKNREDALTKLQNEIEENKTDIENRKAKLVEQQQLLETIQNERK